MADTFKYDRRYREARLAELRKERDSFIGHWRDLSDHILPRQSRFLYTDRNRGEKRNQKIIDNTSTLAARTLASGMMSGLTSPARPWFTLRTPDPELNEFRPVKLWLDIVRARMQEVFLRSNLYTTLPRTYADLGVYGTSAFAALGDVEDLLRCYHFPLGSYCLAASERGSIDVCYREYMMTVRQMVMAFGKENCSKTVNNLYSKGTFEEWIPVIHAIEPNRDYDIRRAEFSRFKPFKSCYFETGETSDKLLRESGFDRFRILAPRWDVTGEDVYGSSPGMEALGDIRALQLQAKRKQQLIDKGVNPPMGAPVTLRDSRASLLPGDVTYYDQGPQGQKFEPLYDVNRFQYQWLLEDIDRGQRRISRTFFEDLFLMLVNDQRNDITAREIAERHEEKLLMLGPVVERQNDELLDPLIDITYDEMELAGVIPEPPPELQGMMVNVEYVSILAQAMKLVGVQGKERFITFAGAVAQLKPGALDWINEDELMQDYADTVGVPAKIINDPELVREMRERKQQQAQARQMAEAGMMAAEGAEKLAKADLSTDNVLNRMVKRVQEQAQ